MHGLWPFRRRSPELDDLISAYVEGRTDGAEDARLRLHFAGDPATLDDIESLRATVSLLQSVAPASAPRSFALQEAPAPSPSVLNRYQWAPAMASAAAAIIVGLLVVGDLTGALRQTGGPAPVAQPATGAIAEAPAVLAVREVEAETIVEKEAEAAPLMAEAPRMMKAAEADSPEMAPEGTVPAERALAGDAAEADAPPAEAIAARAPEEPQAVEKAAEAPAEMRPVDDAPPVPGTGGGITPELAEQEGLSLPVWQMEAAFGAAAVVLAAGAWLLLRRRSRRL